MKNVSQTLRQSIIGVASALLCGSVFATPINSGPNSLQDGLNSLTKGGAFYDVNTSQYSPDEVWEMSALGSQVSVLLFELSSFHEFNTFGIYDPYSYDPNDPSSLVYLELYDGSSTTGTKRNLMIDESLGEGDIGFGVFDQDYGYISHTYGFETRQFGYYLRRDPPGQWYYSESALNDGGADHMVTFRGDDTLKLDVDGPGGNGYAFFSPAEFILAFEDGDDYDFSDFVVLVESVIPVEVAEVSEPSYLGLLGLGLLSLALRSRRRREYLAIQ